MPATKISKSKQTPHEALSDFLTSEVVQFYAGGELCPACGCSKEFFETLGIVIEKLSEQEYPGLDKRLVEFLREYVKS